MTPNGDRRLIEDYLPIDKISAESSHEKLLRKGHISTLHLWWARRPLVACRAAVYGALVPLARFRPANGPENKRDSLARANASKFVERLCKYPGDPKVIAEAEEHILEAHAERLTRETGQPVTAADIREGRAPRPKVLDMFAGGGAIPLEALRLGCDAYALDLNPVAHLIELCTLVYPQKYGKPDPTAKGSGEDGTWAGLAAEVEHWGKWVLGKVKAEIGDLYPPIPDPENPPEELAPALQPSFADESFPQPAQPTLKAAGGWLTPVAYLWTRTVRCKNPACGATVPLVRQTWLCKKKGRYAALKLVAPKGEKRVRFEVVQSTTEDGFGFDPASFSKGGNATCPFCGAVADSAYVKAEGCAGRMGQQMMAIVCTRPGRQGKVYLSADAYPQYVPDDAAIEKRVEALCRRTGLSVPDEPIINDAKNANFCVLYGLTDFGRLFTPRQLMSLLTICTAVRAVELPVSRHTDRQRATAILVYLAFVLNRLADWNSTLCSWCPESTGGAKIRHTFVRQALPMVWDFTESALWGNATGSVAKCEEWVLKGLEAASVGRSECTVVRGSAMALPNQPGTLDAVLTDPPYFDNVPYANISDFFYIWLKRTVGHLYPEHFSGTGTPKRSEAVADATRHGGNRKQANAAYEHMMAEAFGEAHRVLKPGGAMTVVYAHKTTLGWSTLVDALRRAGFTIAEAWPLDTETTDRMAARQSSALASSIFLVARKREGARVGAYERDVQSDLESIVRERVESLWEMGVSGADLVIAAVGAGLRAFTRYARVEYANGEEVPAERFLAEVEGVVLETLLEKVFAVPRSGVAAVDAPSRFYVLWRYAYGAAELDAGEAIVFSYGQPVELDGAKGLTAGARALAEKKAGKYRLRDYRERGGQERLGLPADDGARAPLIDVLHRLLWLLENQPAKLTEFLGQAQPDGERLRLLAQALSGAALKGAGTETRRLVATTTPEQAALAKLVANWRAVIEDGLFNARR